MKPSGRAAVIEVGSRLSYEGEHWQVASLGADDVLLRRGVRAVRVSVQALVLSGALKSLDVDGAVLGGLTPVDALPEQERKQAYAMVEAITLMRTGYRRGAPGTPGQEPDPRFTEAISQREREAALAAEVGMSDRQVRRLCADYDRFGVVGLVDARRTKMRKPLGDCEPQVRKAIVTVLNAQTHGSKINAVNTRLQVRDLVNDWHAQDVITAAAAGEPPPQQAPFPAERTFRKYLAELARGRGQHLSMKQVRSNSNRPTGPYGSFLATRPFEVVLIDSSPVDMFCMDVTTGRWQRVVITIAMCLYSRSLVAWRFTPGDPNAADAALLLHDMVTPKRVGTAWDPIAHWRYCIPENIVVEPDAHPAAGLPFGWPEQVVVDHGKIFLAHDFSESCRGLSINIQYARPYTPTDKAHIERLFRTIREQFWQRLPGYKGPDVWSRGAKAMVEDQAFLFLHELEDKFAEWVATGYQNTVHEGLELPTQPALHLTPNEMYDHGIATAGFLRVIADPDVFIELLPSAWRTVQHYGVEINGVRYNRGTEDLPDPLGGFRDRKSPWAAQKGKWLFKADPRDLSTIYFWRPNDPQDTESAGAWAVIYRAGDYGHLPFTGAELAYAKKVV